jgi:tetratricopeptide (TPR) repeat protein
MNLFNRLKGAQPPAGPAGLVCAAGCFYVSQLHIQADGTPSHEFLHFTPQGQAAGLEFGFAPGGSDQVLEQFATLPNHMLMKGKYTAQGPELKFQLASRSVTVDYQGRISGDRLLLHLHSRKNDYRSDEIYSFVATRQQQLDNLRQGAVLRPAGAPRAAGAGQASAQLAEQAWQFDKQGRPLDALQHFDQALAANPLEHNLYYGRGVVYCKTQNYCLALADLNRALALVPDFPAALTERGLAFLESGNLEQARADYEHALQADPDYAQAHINLGSLYARQGQWAAALKALSAGLRLKPAGDEVAYLNRATAYTQLGNPAAARRDLERYLQAFPQGQYVEQARQQMEALDGA